MEYFTESKIIFMKILYLADTLHQGGGIGRITADKLNYLSTIDGYQVGLAYLQQGEFFYEISPKVKLFPVENLIKGLRTAQRLKVVRKIKQAYMQVFEDFSPDVIVCAMGSVVSYIIPLTKWRKRSIYEFHFSKSDLNIIGHNAQTGIENILLNNARRFLLGRYRYTVALVDSDYKAWKYKNMLLIPNFSDAVLKNKDAVVDVGSKKIVFCGRLVYQKGLEYLFEVWKVLSKKYIDWELFIYGENNNSDLSKSYIQTINGLERAYYKEVTHDIDNIYGDKSIFILPSRFEVFGLVLVEAMSYGLPCVSFDLDGPHEIISDRQDGYLIPPYDIDKMVKALSDLIDNEFLRKQMGLNAKKNIQRYSTDNVMRTWIDVFESIVAENRK